MNNQIDKQIMEMLEQGKSYRDIEEVLNVYPKRISHVRKQMPQFRNPIPEVKNPIPEVRNQHEEEQISLHCRLWRKAESFDTFLSVGFIMALRKSEDFPTPYMYYFGKEREARVFISEVEKFLKVRKEYNGEILSLAYCKYREPVEDEDGNEYLITWQVEIQDNEEYYRDSE